MASTRDTLLKTLAKINVERIPPAPVAKVKTGILSLDALLHGGLPEGRVIEIFGPEHSGKSTTSMLFMRQYAHQGKYTALLDAENTTDQEYAEKYGLDLNMVDDNGRPMVDIIRATTAEEWFDALREIVKSRAYDLIIVDTLAAFVPKVEFESSIDKGTMGVFPRLVSRFYRTVGPLMYDNPVTIIVLNQVRLDIGNANPHTGAPMTSPGGFAQRHVPSIKLQMMKPNDKLVGETLVGHVFRFKIVKCKVFTANVKQVHELHIAIDPDTDAHDVDYSYELFTAAKRLKLLTDKDGKAYEKLVAYFEGEKLGNGEEQILRFLDEPSDLRDRLEAAVYAALEGGQLNGTSGPDPEDFEAAPDADAGAAPERLL